MERDAPMGQAARCAEPYRDPEARAWAEGDSLLAGAPAWGGNAAPACRVSLRDAGGSDRDPAYVATGHPAHAALAYLWMTNEWSGVLRVDLLRGPAAGLVFPASPAAARSCPPAALGASLLASYRRTAEAALRRGGQAGYEFQVTLVSGLRGRGGELAYRFPLPPGGTRDDHAALAALLAGDAEASRA